MTEANAFFWLGHQIVTNSISSVSNDQSIVLQYESKVQLTMLDQTYRKHTSEIFE